MAGRDRGSRVTGTRMRLRDHNRWDLALTAVTLGATAVGAGLAAARRIADRRRRAHGIRGEA